MIEKKVLIQSKNGNTLHGILYLHNEESRKKALVIMCHGFTGDKYELGRFTEMAKKCNEEGYDGLVFDFTGSGENTREPVTISKQFLDLEGIYEWAKNEDYKKIAVLGLSLGGLTVLGANLPDVDAYVLWAPVTFLHTTNDQSSWFKDISSGPVEIPTSGETEPITIDMSFVIEFGKFRVKSALKRVIKPVLIVQGTADESVPCELTKKAFRFIPENERNKFVEIKGAGHNFEGNHIKQFIDSTIEWLKKNL